MAPLLPISALISAEMFSNIKFSIVFVAMNVYSLGSPVLGFVLLVARALDYVSPRYALLEPRVFRLGECLDR